MREIKLANYNCKLLVDDSDYNRCIQHNWHGDLSSTGGYTITTSINNKKVNIANFILRTTKVLYDHKDRNPLNNQRVNLRISTVSQNTANTPKATFNSRKPSSQYKGVFRSKAPRAQKNPWMARIMKDGISKHLGCFDSEEKAAIAYNAAAVKYHGEFAYINQIINQNQNTKEN